MPGGGGGALGPAGPAAGAGSLLPQGCAGQPQADFTVLDTSPPQVLESWTCCTPSLASLLVLRGLAPQLVSSPLLPALAAASLEAEGETSSLLRDQLREAGHGVLAATLQVGEGCLLDNFEIVKYLVEKQIGSMQ